MMSYQVNRANTVTTVEGSIQTVVSPVHRVVSSLWLGIANGWTDYVGLIGRASEADALRERIGVLERRANTLEESARENARLRQLLGLRERLDVAEQLAPRAGATVHKVELLQLADELRHFLIYTVGQTGGHFGAGLGVGLMVFATARSNRGTTAGKAPPFRPRICNAYASFTPT